MVQVISEAPSWTPFVRIWDAIDVASGESRARLDTWAGAKAKGMEATGSASSQDSSGISGEKGTLILEGPFIN